MVAVPILKVAPMSGTVSGNVFKQLVEVLVSQDCTSFVVLDAFHTIKVTRASRYQGCRTAVIDETLPDTCREIAFRGGHQRTTD